MYISRASNFHDLSKIANLNTHEFLELHKFTCIEYQHFCHMICNIVGIIIIIIIERKDLGGVMSD